MLVAVLASAVVAVAPEVGSAAALAQAQDDETVVEDDETVEIGEVPPCPPWSLPPGEVDGPLDADPAIRLLQRERAAMGLRSDAAWVHEVAALPADLVEWGFGFPMTPEEWQDFVERSGLLSSRTGSVRRYGEAHPESFGGLLLDHARHLVVVGFTGDVATHQAALDAQVGPGLVEVVEVAFSEAQLDRWIAAILAVLQAEGWWGDPVVSLSGTPLTGFVSVGAIDGDTSWWPSIAHLLPHDLVCVADEEPVCPLVLLTGTIAVSSTVVAPGETVQVSGEGWVVPGPGCSFVPPEVAIVELRQGDPFADDPWWDVTELARVGVDDDETFAVDVTIPADALPGPASINVSSPWVTDPDFTTDAAVMLEIVVAVPAEPRFTG